MSEHRRLRDLPRAVRVVLAGGVINAFGSGLVFPFLGIFLREGVGLSISRAGVVLAVFGLSGIAATPVVGWLSDHVGPKPVIVVLLGIAAVGFAGLVIVHSFAMALAVSCVAGVGNGSSWPAQSTLLNALCGEADRTLVFAASRAGTNLGIGVGGMLGGFLAVNGRRATYDRLFVLDAITFLLFAVVLSTVTTPALEAHAHAASASASYATLLRNRWFVQLLAVDLATAVTFSLAFELLPLHAVARLSITNRVVGFLFLLNTASVGGCQLLTVRLLAGRRRMPAYVGMHVAFAAGLFAVLLAPHVGLDVRIAVLGTVMVVLGLAETVFGAVRSALITELFDPALMGRAFGASGALFQLGMAGTRAGGAAILDHSAVLPWVIGGMICVAAALQSARMERTMPPASLRNPAAVVA